MDNKNIRKRFFDELDGYLNEKTFTKEQVVVDVSETICYKEASNNEKAMLVDMLKNHRVHRGINKNGYRMFFDENDMKIKTQDIGIVSILVQRKMNRPVAIATFIDTVDKIFIGNHCYSREVVMDEGHEKIYPIKLKMPANQIENAFYNAKYFIADDTNSHEMDFENIRFDQESIETFYGFDGQYCVEFTPRILDRYWNSNSLDLYRYTINKMSAENGFGLNFPIFTDKLIEVDWGAVYIDDITEEEIAMISPGHEDSWIVKEIKKKYFAQHNDDEADKEKKKEKINELINNIQNVINSSDENIIDFAIDKVGSSTAAFEDITDKAIRLNAKKNFLAKTENSFGLDCGFIYFMFKDDALRDLCKETAEYGLSRVFKDGTFCINLPYENQSTTIKRYQAMIIKDIVKNNLGIDISYKTVLD